MRLGDPNVICGLKSVDRIARITKIRIASVLAAWVLIIFCKSSANMYIPNNAKFIRKRFAYQCFGNVKMYKYANFDQNTMLPCGSSVLLKCID